MAIENDSSKFLLSSVNVLLQAINQLAISDDVDLANILEAQKAQSTLEEVKKAVLASGWDFNTDDEWELIPDSNGYISVPYNILDITSTDGDAIMRDWRLYSKSNRSPIFDSPVTCKIVWDMDFNSLSHPIRHYITIRASRIFQMREIGDKVIYTYTEDDEHQAYISARRSDGRTGQYNMLTSEYGILHDVREL